MSQNLGSGQSKGSSNTFYMWLDSKSHKLNLLDVTDRALDAGPGVVSIPTCIPGYLEAGVKGLLSPGVPDQPGKHIKNLSQIGKNSRDPQMCFKA